MKTFLRHLRDIAISGFFALLPLYVLFIVLAKAWKSLSSVGAGIAGIFGMKPVLGVGGTTIFSGLLVITLWIVIGLLVRFSFMAALSRAAERAMSKYIPGYDTYKAIAEEKLQHKVRALDYTSALVRWQDYWRPAYIVEQDADGTCVLFLPDVPETNKGHVLLAKQDQVRVVSSITANQLDASLKKMGRGLCSEYGLHS
jgi:uncharacterized membrane protein